MSRRQFARELRTTINQNNAAYYNGGTPIMDDAQHDMLLDTLRAFEAEHPELVTPDSPTQTVGAEPPIDNRVAHQRPILSLRHSKTKADVICWLRQAAASCNKSLFTVEEKIDGLTAVVTYNYGKLVSVVTRGNGRVGTDVTFNAPIIANLPTSIPLSNHVIVRGEVFMTFDEFDRVNHDRQDRQLPSYRKPANAASAILQSKHNYAEPKLQIRFFDFVDGMLHCRNQLDFFTVCYQLGLDIVKYDLETADNIGRAIDKMERARQSFDHPTDGLVIKAYSFADRKKLGASSTSPNWAIALKELVIQTRPSLDTINLRPSR